MNIEVTWPKFQHQAQKSKQTKNDPEKKFLYFFFILIFYTFLVYRDGTFRPQAKALPIFFQRKLFLYVRWNIFIFFQKIGSYISGWNFPTTSAKTKNTYPEKTSYIFSKIKFLIFWDDGRSGHKIKKFWFPRMSAD